MGKKTRGLRLEFPKPAESKSNTAIKKTESTAAAGPVGGGSGTVSSNGSKTDLTEILEQDGDLENLLKKVCDSESLERALSEWQSIKKFRDDLSEKNVKPNYDEFEELRNSRKLDANLKKCTNFVKKVKTFTGSQLDQIEKEFVSLNLTKYLSEIASGFAEARFKFQDINNVVVLYSKFHQRYREFAELSMATFNKSLLPKKAEFNPSLLSKLSIDIRLFGELLLCGVFEKTEGFNLLISSVKNLIAMDKDGGLQYSSPIISFCRGLGYEMAGVMAPNVKEACEATKQVLPPSTLLPEDKKVQMKHLLMDYYNMACTVLTKSHEEGLSSELRNRKFLRTKGEVPDDRLSEHIELMTVIERQNAIVKKLAFYLDATFPTLRELPPDQEAEQANTVLARLNDEQGAEAGPAVTGTRIFDDEDTRAFYQDLPDMKVYLPQGAYRDNILKTAAETAKIAEREKELANVDEELEMALLNSEGEQLAFEEEEDTGRPDQIDEEKPDDIKPTFQKFLDGLLNCVNSEMVNKAAKEFVDNFNSRPNRKKLVKTLFHIPRQRVDLIPLWARLVAVLSPVMPEIQLELCDWLFREYKKWLRKKDPIFIESKLKFTRYIGELVNFGLFPKADAFTCFKLLLMDFVHHQIEMACAFLETCGKYLLRNPDSHRRMHIYLEEFVRKKTLKSLEPRYAVMVDNAYTFVCPPETGNTKKKRKHPLFAYMRYIMYNIMNRENLDDCIEKMRCIDWEDPKAVNYFVCVASQPWHLQANQYSTCASLLAALVPFHSEVITRVVDNVVEETYQKIGSVNLKFNDRRIASILFIGEFYNYRLLSSSEIFAILYALISHYVILDYNAYNPFDPLENLFRVRLACTLLKTCGQYYQHGNSKKKLNCYLKYLQRYYWFKKEAPFWTERNRFPCIIIELFEDTVKWLRPTWEFATSFAQSCEEIKELEAKLMESLNINPEDLLLIKEQQEQEQTQEQTQVQPSTGEDRESTNDSPANAIVEGDYGIMRNLETPQETNQEIDLENITITEENWELFKPSEAELADFDSQIERLGSSHNIGRQIKTDIPVPINANTSKVVSEKKSEPGKVGFVLLTKKGNKQALKQITMDEDSEFVKRINASRKAEEEERRKIKQLTLGITRRQQEEEANEDLINSLFSSKVN